MKKQTRLPIGLLALLLVSAFASAASDESIPGAGDNASALPLHPKFRSHLKCPYADRWLAKGPERAAYELGLDSRGYGRRRGRRLEEQQSSLPVKGSCTFINAFAGGTTCMQFAGTDWTEDDMTSRCDQEKNGTFSTEGCGEAAGWCHKSIVDGSKVEVTAMVLSAMADCDMNAMACKTFMGGTYVADDACLGEASSSGGENGDNLFGGDDAASSSMSGPPPGVFAAEGGASWQDAAAAGGDSAMKCMIAPGAIGAAHQAGFSKGYSASCPGTPAQESPYMWPLKWSAETETQAMAYGSDEVVYTSRGKTFYLLNKNWKRSDTIYQEGVLRALGQGPCADAEGEFAKECAKNQTDGSMNTMIHRENLMYFISWKTNETDPVQPGEVDANRIEECTMINLAVVGNIRPDWFLDKRGDDTDVQYLGDQHVYYGESYSAKMMPRLVKQWRKKDFASQYFVMSMTGNPPNKLENRSDASVEDNIHWPLILNIPGEGFGDDMLQSYRNHALLTDDDEDLFMLIENYETLGGVCTDLRAGNEEGGDVGPPIGGAHIPSNLEVDPLSWVSNEITFSPIWQIPASGQDSIDMSGSIPSTSSGGSKSVLEVSDRVTVESCYDEATEMMDMSIHFHDVVPGASDGLLPWMAIGYRPSDLCAMTPPGGGSTPIVLVTQASEGSFPEAHTTSLPSEAKAVSQDAFASMYSNMKPLEDVEEYSSVSVEALIVSSSVARSSSSLAVGEDTVSLHFKQSVEGGKPEVMNLMYAIGMTSQLGVHVTRGCFQVVQPVLCGSGEAGSEEESKESLTIDLGEGEEEAGKAAVQSPAVVASSGFMLTLLALLSIAIGL